MNYYVKIILTVFLCVIVIACVYTYDTDVSFSVETFLHNLEDLGEFPRVFNSDGTINGYFCPNVDTPAEDSSFLDRLVYTLVQGGRLAEFPIRLVVFAVRFLALVVFGWFSYPIFL